MNREVVRYSLGWCHSLFCGTILRLVFYPVEMKSHKVELVRLDYIRAVIWTVQGRIITEYERALVSLSRVIYYSSAPSERQSVR